MTEVTGDRRATRPSPAGGAPCWLNTKQTSGDLDWPGSPCLMQMGTCLTCGKIDGLGAWASMAHERYGLWANKITVGGSMERKHDGALAKWREHARQQDQIDRLVEAVQTVLAADPRGACGLAGWGELGAAWRAVTGREIVK